MAKKIRKDGLEMEMTRGGNFTLSPEDAPLTYGEPKEGYAAALRSLLTTFYHFVNDDDQEWSLRHSLDELDMIVTDMEKIKQPNLKSFRQFKDFADTLKDLEDLLRIAKNLTGTLIDMSMDQMDSNTLLLEVEKWRTWRVESDPEKQEWKDEIATTIAYQRHEEDKDGNS
jgi:hypothetical protein